MGLHLGYYLFLNDLCPDLVDTHAGDDSTSKDLKLLIIGFYFSFDLDWHLSWLPALPSFLLG
jgi:hypothetical protein